MAREKTWDFNYNVTPTDSSDITAQGRSFVMQLKDYMITTAGWVVTESCDSVAVGGAGVDKWDALTDIVAGTGAHSWMVLKSPEGFVAGLNGTYAGDQSRLWFIINMRYANYYTAEFTVCRVAPTGGSTTAAPTALYPSPLYATQQFINNPLIASTTFHFASTSDGGILAMTSIVGGGIVHFGLMIMPLVDPRVVTATTFDYPYSLIIVFSWLNSGLGAFSRAVLGAGSVNKGFGFDGMGTAMTFNALGNATGWIDYSCASTGDNINGEHEASAIWITCLSTNYQGSIGRLADIFGSGLPSAQGLVDNASPTKTVIGNLHIPTDVIIVL